MTGRARLALVAAAALALLPALLPHPFVLTIATQAAIWALLAASWDLLSGYAGQISFGHAGFFALGAYAAAAATKHADVIALKTDFKNAFNLVDRSVLLQETRLRCLSIAPWVEFC